ncbi:hypothetical protein CHS0354_016606 [Potamilus streckersoni]|uniref:Tudor domain-containing protein 1 n=1 Tax=Potamilus streckersoni TaxID=2493646 RepID=A0AAE0TI75_9BIVA|nr:hypothetical protein CHS0354_016606 [Potamilus streckersoni]
MSLSNFQQLRIPSNLEDWNPQSDDFNSSLFNCYDRGPGKYLPKRQPSSSQKQVQLYVQGIPNEMTEDGLRNLFMKAGTVTKVLKMTSKKPGALDTYGFITMSNVREADEAIRRFNYFKINQFMLKVRIAVSPEEREQQQLRKKEDEEFFESLRTRQGKAWSSTNGTNSEEDSRKENWGSLQQSNGYGFSSAESPQSSPKYGIGRGGFLKGYQDSAKVGPSGDGQKLQGAGGMSGLHNAHVLRDSFQGQEGPQFSYQRSPNQSYSVEGLKITIGKSDSLNESRLVLPTDETMTLRHHSSDQHYTSFGQGLMQQGRVLRQDRFTPTFGRGRKPAMGRGYNHYCHNHGHVGRGRGFQKPNFYRMPAACCDHGLYDPSHQSFALQPGLINVPSYVNPGFYMQSPYLLQAVPMAPQIQMQSTAATKREDSRSVSEKSPKTVKLEPRECTFCKKIGTFQCKRCKIPYCCTDCQKQDWPRHKNYCSKIKEMQITDEFKDFDVTVGEDLVENVKTLIEKHTGDAVIVDKSSLEKASNVQQQQNRKYGKQKGKTGTGDQSGKGRESRDAQDIQTRSKVADYNRKDISSGSDKEHVAVNNQIDQNSPNQSPHKNKMRTWSEDYNRGKERTDQLGNQNRRGGAKRKNDIQKSQNRNKQKDGRTVANEREYEDITIEEQFGDVKTNVAATTQTVPKLLSKKQPGSYPHPVADNLQQSSGPVFVSELASVLSEVKVGEELEVIITAYVSPSNFTVQIIQLERIQMFSAFSDKLNELYDEEKEPYRPGKVGELVVARYSLDQKWYRAEVTKLSPSTVSLSFIDFGNEEDTSYSQICKAKPMCKEVASQSLKCCMMGMESQTITKEDIEEFGRRLKQIADPRQGRILFTIKAISKGYVVVDTVDVESNRSLAAVMSERFSFKKTKTHVSSADKSFSPVADIKILELPCDGSSVLGQMVDITGIDSFHIQPQDEASKSHLKSLMDQIQQYCASMPTPYIPVIGELVCALFPDDNIWYRAQVKRKVEKDIYSVCFVDYGNHANVDVSSIRVLEKKFAELPCMGIPCRLAGLRDKDNQDFLQEFVTMVMNTVVKIKAVRFRDGFYDVEISLTDGTSVNKKVGCTRSTANEGELRKAEAGAASERVMTADVPCQQLPVHCQVSVELIELESLDCFYLKRTDIYDATEFQELESEIGIYCVSNMTAHTPVVGELVAAKFTNNKWYRANVLQVKPTECHVIFIDYGNQDDVENYNIRKLRKEFTKMPFVAIKCKLSGIQATADDAKLLIFAEDVIGQNIKAQAIGMDKNGVTEVKLFSVSGSCINDRVALTGQKEICTGLSKINEPLKKESKTEMVLMAKDVRPVELPTDGSKIQVEIVEIFNLDNFFVKTVDDTSRVKLDSQQIEMNIFYKEDSTGYTPVIDELVAALFEGVWYRGKVIEGDGNLFNILYADFGNVSAVTKNQIRKLKSKFADLPLMAIPSRLQGLKGTVTQDMLLAFAGYVVEKRVLLESHGFISGVMEVVLFTDNGICINKKLGLQVSSMLVSVPTSLTTTTSNTGPTSQVTVSHVHQEEIKPALMASRVQPYNLTVDGTLVEVEVLVVHSLNSFYVQVTEEKQQRKLKNLMAEMAAFCSSSATSYEPQLGEMVVAQYYEDQMWYRARVEGIQNHVYDVFYVDYGNMEQVQASSLRKFDPMYGTLPQMAVHCKLSYSCTENDSDLRIAKFAQEVLMKKVLMKAAGYVDEKYEVVIYLSDGTTIQSILGLEKEEKVVASQIPVIKMVSSGGVARHMADQMMKVDLPEDGSFIDAVVFEMKGPDSFYIQKRSEEVKMLLEQIEEYCSKQTSTYAPVIGELVCAKFSQDNSWYRARVDELIEEGVYKVLFVDYGNSDIVSEQMIKCDDIIFSVPQQGILCKLSEVGAIHMDEKLQVFVSSLVNVLVKVRVLKCINGVYEVELYTGDGSACINNELKILSKSSTEVVLTEENIDAIVASAIYTSASSASQDIIPGTSMERKVVQAKDFPHAEPIGSEFGIVITSVVDPRCFYCQLADEEVVSAFGEMMDRLSEHCQSEPALPDVVYTEGELCCAKFPADGKWYRACIMQLNPNGTALVYYVDFGNEEVISLDDLNILTEEFQTLPILALRCSLSGIHPNDGVWKPEAVEVLKSLQEQVLRVKLVEVFNNTYYLIVLHTREGGETVSLNQILIEAGLAQVTPVKKPGPALAESLGTDGGEQVHGNVGRSTPDENVKEKEELLLQEIEALKAKYEALKMKGNS